MSLSSCRSQFCLFSSSLLDDASFPDSALPTMAACSQLRKNVALKKYLGIMLQDAAVKVNLRDYQLVMYACGDGKNERYCTHTVCIGTGRCTSTMARQLKLVSQGRILQKQILQSNMLW